VTPPRYLPLKFAAAGVVSGMLCWLGGLLAPQNSILIKFLPGLIFGAALYAVGRHAALAPPRPHGVTFAMLMAVGVGAWRAAVDIGYMHGQPLPMLAAGALGGLVLSLGLGWAWGWRRGMALSICAIVGTGAFVAQAVRWWWDAYPTLNDELEISVLFVGWQALVMLAIGLTTSAIMRARH
jgi:hypothetical protein